MRRETVVNSLECKYTPEQMAEIAKKLSGAVAELESVAAEKKTSDSVYNGRIKKIEEEIGTLAKSYNRGYEMQEITCDIRYDDPAPGQKSVYRVDTKELVSTKEMTFEEKQEELQFNLPQPTDEEISAVMDSTTKDLLAKEVEEMEARGELPPEPRITEVPPEDPPEAA